MTWFFSSGFFVIVRFVVAVLSIAWAAYVVPLFRTILAHPLPQNIPHRREIYIGQGISGVFSVILPIWIALILYLNLDFRFLEQPKGGRGLLVYCVIDCIMIGLMIISSACQSSYLAVGNCQRASTWQLFDKDINLFQLTHDPVDGNVEETCQYFLNAWALNISAVILAVQSAIYPLTKCSIEWRAVWWIRTIRRTLSRIYTVWVWASIVSIRDAVFERQATESGEKIEMQQWRQSRKPTLYDILNEDVDNRTITSLASNLHYSDIVSISFTSKKMNSAVFPKNRSGRVERISIASCEENKLECWSCGMEICKTCSKSMGLPKQTSTTHIDNCEPYCSICYHKTVYRRGNSRSTKRQRRLNYSSGINFNCACRCTVPPGNYVQRSLCKFCFTYGVKVALEIKEAREKSELRHLVKQQLRCVVCTRGLNKGGLRWWGCSLCQSECFSDVHPKWDEKSQLIH